MRNIYMRPSRILLVVVLFLQGLLANAQLTDSIRPTVKVAVLIPLYLDSAFHGTTYKLGNSNIPKYILPGLDFYNGVMMA
ncbi:MAG TPA: hypothetical protein VF145_12035, partial [Chitinophagaceae bacterium]